MPNIDPDIKNGQPVRERVLAFLDIETTGLELNHEIIEIGVVRVSQKDWEIVEEFEMKVKPRHMEDADPFALEITGYTDEAWKDAITLPNALNILEQKCKGDILIGQNFSFDWARLEKAFTEAGHPLPAFYYHRMDLKSMLFYKYYDEDKIKTFSLSEISAYLGLDRGISHNALSDAKATYRVFKKIMEEN
ncbi:MAG: 3'-5' exonuclease [Candidatus Parcubacteria bacterium]|nr:3'-5' exonuclease [Candidatus Parcubacteria bacterium]